MMKKNNCKLYKGQKHTIYEIQNAIGVSKDMLYKYARGYRKVSKMKLKTILDIAMYEHEEPNKLYKMMLEWEVQNEKNK